jgi:hypothetical protein
VLKRPTILDLVIMALGGATVACLVPGGAAAQAERPAVTDFEPRAALCDRQTFLLETASEAAPWFAYLGDMRRGGAQVPDPDICPSSTLQQILGVLGAPDLPTAEGRRAALLASRAAGGVMAESAERGRDQEGTFRYRNDLVVAGFAWLLCPGTGAAQGECVAARIRELPDGILATSPVLCDFAQTREIPVDPAAPEDGILLCDRGDGTEGWLDRLRIATGGI